MAEVGDEDAALADQNVGSDDISTYEDPKDPKNNRIMLGSADEKGKRTAVWLGFRHVNGKMKHCYYASSTGQEELDEESHTVSQYLDGLKQRLTSYDSPTSKHRARSSRSGVCDSNEEDTRPRKRARANTPQGPSDEDDIEAPLGNVLQAHSSPITQRAKIPWEGSKGEEPVNQQNVSTCGIDVMQPSALSRQQMDQRYEDYKQQ